MNSMEEKEYFERYGWEYDFIKRVWVSPTGSFRIPNDLLMANATGPESQEQLMGVSGCTGACDERGR